MMATQPVFLSRALRHFAAHLGQNRSKALQQPPPLQLASFNLFGLATAFGHSHLLINSQGPCTVTIR